MPEQNIKDRRDVAAARRHWINYLERNQSIIVQLFCGQTRSVVRCFLCNGESVTYREFTNLTLLLPENSNRYWTCSIKTEFNFKPFFRTSNQFTRVYGALLERGKN